MPVLRHPAQIIVGSFAFAVLAGTLLLLLPVSTTEPGSATPLTAHRCSSMKLAPGATLLTRSSWSVSMPSSKA